MKRLRAHFRPIAKWLVSGGGGGQPAILMENSGYILMEDGSHILTEA